MVECVVMMKNSSKNKKLTGKEKIVIGNWKMNPIGGAEAKELFLGIRKSASKTKRIKIIVCPPFIFLESLGKLVSLKNRHFSLGAQDSHFEEKGPRTGEISPIMLRSVGVRTVIIGHSEKREAGENDEVVNKKVLAALGAGLAVVVCVGESIREQSGKHLFVIRRQVRAALRDVSKSDFKKVIIAYEPVWAIGSKAVDVITSRDLHQMSIYIKKVLSEMYDSELARSVPVVYGGSVDVENARSLVFEGCVDGLLLGRASLDVQIFSNILSEIEKGEE